MKGFLVFMSGCALVAGLSAVAPDTARWLVVGALVGGIYVASALPRRRERPSRIRREARVRGEASGR